MNYLEQNCSLIAANDHALANAILAGADGNIQVVTTADGLPVPLVPRDGKPLPLHSRFDPVRESERFIDEVSTGEYDMFVVFGLGFAYHVEVLLGRVHRDALVVVIEKSAAIINACMTYRDMGQVIGDSRFILLLDPDEDILAERLKGRSSRRVTFITHRGSHQLHGEYYRNMGRVCRSYISTKEVNIATLAKFEKTWTANIARNVNRFMENPGISSFFGRFSGIPAIVVAAGPSLTDSIPFIRENSSRAVIIAVDTSWRILRHHGIEPHFCVSVDPQLINARYFEGAAAGRTILISDPTVHPSVFRLYGGRAAMAGIAFPMMKWLEEGGAPRGEVAHGGSVSTNAYDFAKRLGASPVIMVGQDLAFTRGLAHARGSYLDEQMFLRTGRFRTVEMINRGQLRALPPVYVRGIRTGKVQTNQKMMIFLSWFSRRKDPDLVNCTRDGSRIPGVEHRDDSEMILPEQDKSIWDMVDWAWRESLGGIPSAHDRDLLRDRIARMSGEIDELLPSLEKAVGYSSALGEAMERGDGGKIDYILKRLNETDRMIESRTTVKDMVGFAIQRVIHTITEGYSLDGTGDDSSSGKQVAERSLFLYRGFLDGALFIRKTLGRMGEILG